MENTVWGNLEDLKARLENYEEERKVFTSNDNSMTLFDYPQLIIMADMQQVVASQVVRRLENPLEYEVLALLDNSRFPISQFREVLSIMAEHSPMEVQDRTDFEDEEKQAAYRPEDYVDLSLLANRQEILYTPLSGEATVYNPVSEGSKDELEE